LDSLGSNFFEYPQTPEFHTAMAFPRPTKTYDDVPELNFKGVYIAGKPANSRWDVCCRKGLIKEMEQSVESGDPSDGFMAPSLCHVSHVVLRSSTPTLTVSASHPPGQVLSPFSPQVCRSRDRGGRFCRSHEVDE